MTEEVTKRLRLMRFWLFGTFCIIAAAQLTVGVIVPGNLFADPYYWYGLAFSAALFTLWYIFYRWWLIRRSD